jgi:hypothetical protein
VKEGIVTDISKEILHWLFFSIAIGLAQLWLIPLFYYLFQKHITWVELIGNGSLLFFATTVTSKTAAEYFRKVKGDTTGHVLCFALAILIIMASVTCYAAVTATRGNLVPAASLSPERVTFMSDILAGAGIVFSLAYTSLIRAFGK